jgi:hypothetical protein
MAKLIANAQTYGVARRENGIRRRIQPRPAHRPDWRRRQRTGVPACRPVPGARRPPAPFATWKIAAITARSRQEAVPDLGPAPQKRTNLLVTPTK